MSVIKHVSPILLAVLLPLTAQEPAKEVADPRPVPAGPMARTPWVGLEVGKLDDAMRAHVVDVPMGAGFLITGVTAGSPADKAGLRSYDILWKFNDQILINEAQFGTLLRMHKIGDSVNMTIVRSGKHLAMDLELAPAPPRQVQSEISPVDIPLVPAGVPGMPRSIVYPQARKAVVSREDGSTAQLHHEDGEAMVVIRDGDGETIYEGPVRKDGKMVVPRDWKCSVGALMRTMHHAEDDDWKVRRPRPRVVTPPVVRER